MAGIRAGRKLLLGQESVAGTVVAATGLWRGPVDMPDDQRGTVFPSEDVGYISGLNRVYTPFLQAGLTMPSTELTFEQFPYILSASIKNVVAGIADGGGSGKVYTYTEHSSASSLNTLKTYSLWCGDNQAQDVIEYGFVESWTVSGKPKEGMKVSAEWIGRQISSGSFATVSVPTVEEVPFGKGKLYIDSNSSGSMGQTLVSNTLLGVDLSCKTGWVPVFSGDGNLYFSFIKAVEPEVVLKVTFEHDSNSTAEKTAWRAGTARQIRLQWQGTALSSAATYTYKTLRFDLAGKWEKFDKIAEMDGNDIVTGTFRARYDTTASKFFEVVVVNEVTTLP